MDGKKNMDHGDALMALKEACRGLGGFEWQQICAIADKKLNSIFFEAIFQSILIDSTEHAPFTSHFEPELEGSLTPTRRFRHLISVVPHEVSSGGIWKTRRDFEKNQLLKGRGPEVALVESLAVVFFFANSWARLWRRQWPQLSLD